MPRSPQQSFVFRTHGGPRRGAGKKKIKFDEPAHIAREKITKHVPFHCGLKLTSGAPGLRNAPMFTAITDAFKRAQMKGLKVTEFSIESNHVHFIAEADTNDAISRGLMSIAASITWALRKIFGYYGAVFSKRYFMHAIKKPREMLHALVYVLFNHAKHLKIARYVDPYSSAHAFDDIDRLIRNRGKPMAWTARVKRSTVDAQSWLQKTGWKKSLAQYGMPA